MACVHLCNQPSQLSQATHLPISEGKHRLNAICHNGMWACVEGSSVVHSKPNTRLTICVHAANARCHIANLHARQCHSQQHMHQATDMGPDRQKLVAWPDFTQESRNVALSIFHRSKNHHILKFNKLVRNSSQVPGWVAYDSQERQRCPYPGEMQDHYVSKFNKTIESTWPGCI